MSLCTTTLCRAAPYLLTACAPRVARGIAGLFDHPLQWVVVAVWGVGIVRHANVYTAHKMV